MFWVMGQQEVERRWEETEEKTRAKSKNGKREAQCRKAN